MKTIGFIGIGVMGSAMVKNLLKAGFEVYVYTRTKSKADDVVAAGAKWCSSVDECAEGKDAVITIVGFPDDVNQVYFGDENSNGIIKSADKGTYIIDMTTTKPSQAVQIYEAAQEYGLNALDAPVSGGDLGAINGTLTIMVGGKEEDFDACKEMFKAMGTSVIYQGKAGSGQHTKAANQIAIAGALAGTCEAIAYLEAYGLNPGTALESIKNGSASSWQMVNNGAKILDDNMSPGFYVKHFIKDLKIASNHAADLNLDLPMLNTVLKMYLELEGVENLGTQALIYKWKKEN
ncbi:MAG: NAD(P)-dependent oxidoreductase [Christensenellaceae bacterium]|nr:NAD(P)-dependent oxidoreductase [Christensenellaceae bacterium]